MPKVDDRDRHHNRTNKSPQEVVECVKAHTASFPQYQSHYSRRYNINRSYLDPELSIAKMHELYCSNSNWPASTGTCMQTCPSPAIHVQCVHLTVPVFPMQTQASQGLLATRCDGMTFARKNCRLQLQCTM